MPRLRALILAGALTAGGLPAQQKAPPAQHQEPAEEDEALVPKEYAFNPLQAEKELKIGNFYFKKGNYKGAANRFREATRWNPGFAEAFLRLGDAEEKLNDKKQAREAYRKYLELAPKDKRADEVRRKLKSG